MRTEPFLLASLSLFAVLVRGSLGFSPDSDFTFTLPAGRKECFFQPMQREASLEIEYQVLDGAGLDVDFQLVSPNHETLVFEQRKSDGVHTVETEDGDYMFCFDNTFSTLSEKVIFFELILDNMGDEEQEDWKNYITGTDLLDMKLEDILVFLDSSALLAKGKVVPFGEHGSIVVPNLIMEKGEAHLDCTSGLQAGKEICQFLFNRQKGTI